VLFFSDRDGVFHIFKQAIDETQPQLLVGGKEAAALPRLNPDGSMVLYVNSRSDVGGIREPQSPHIDAALGIQQLMRVPVSGGPPQLVLEGRGINNLQCARLPSTLCIYSELAPGEEHFYTFDPLKGKGEEITGAAIHESDFYSFNWSLSPDGKLLAFSKKFGTQGQPAIRLFSLVDAKERLISLPGWAGIATLDWSADGKSLWSTAFTTSETGLWTTGFDATGEWTLLKVELSGKVTPMLREREMNLGWAIPSPDGSKLAIWKAAGTSNVWLAETR
jgi:Tol biopolymer transport system component